MRLSSRTDQTIILKSPAELRIMREAGLVVARTVRELVAALKPGITTKDLDDIALASFKRQQATSTAYGYPPGGHCDIGHGSSYGSPSGAWRYCLRSKARSKGGRRWDAAFAQLERVTEDGARSACAAPRYV
jgi:hypothetical protein